MDFLTLKLIHILSSTVLFGTGLGSAFFVFTANRKGEVSSIAFAMKTVVLADWLFTTPAIITQLITGILLADSLGWSLNEPWILTALCLYFFAGACWLPVVWIQLKMHQLAQKTHLDKKSLPQEYWKLERIWVMLGCLAFPAIIVVFYLMVFKPRF